MAKRTKNNTSKIQVTAKVRQDDWDFKFNTDGDFNVGDVESAIHIIERDLAMLADELDKYNFDISSLRFSIREKQASHQGNKINL